MLRGIATIACVKTPIFSVIVFENTKALLVTSKSRPGILEIASPIFLATSTTILKTEKIRDFNLSNTALKTGPNISKPL